MTTPPETPNPSETLHQRTDARTEALSLEQRIASYFGVSGISIPNLTGAAGLIRDLWADREQLRALCAKQDAELNAQLGDLMRARHEVFSLKNMTQEAAEADRHRLRTEMQALCARWEAEAESFRIGLGDNVRTRLCLSHACQLSALLSSSSEESQ